MKLRGYKDSEIAAKTGLNGHYVRDIVRLMEKGEQRLLKAVLSGQIPITIAMEIAEADDVGVQAALRQAYEKKVLRGRKFLIVKNLIEQRRRNGKTGARAPRRAPQSTTELIRTYRQDADKKRLLIRKAGATRDKLAFVTAALRKLLDEDEFVEVLRKEELETLPRNIALRLQSKKGSPP